MIPDDRLIYNTLPRWEFGAEDDGNLMTKSTLEALRRRVHDMVHYDDGLDEDGDGIGDDVDHADATSVDHNTSKRSDGVLVNAPTNGVLAAPSVCSDSPLPPKGNEEAMHYGTKPGQFETLKIHFPTSEGVSEVSERANE